MNPSCDKRTAAWRGRAILENIVFSSDYSMHSFTHPFTYSFTRTCAYLVTHLDSVHPFIGWLIDLIKHGYFSLYSSCLFLFSHSLIHSFGLFKAPTSSSSHSLICLSIGRFLLPPAVQLCTAECILYVSAPVLRNLKVSTVSSLYVCLSLSLSVCLCLCLSVSQKFQKQTVVNNQK